MPVQPEPHQREMEGKKMDFVTLRNAVIIGAVVWVWPLMSNRGVAGVAARLALEVFSLTVLGGVLSRAWPKLRAIADRL